ncbi:hypothetical protein BDD12DRAFT_805562 [Trichophaea hybrida]|nr:hypothetical protein BDD12DRAFT_805562 [Trichophaea hybrida]
MELLHGGGTSISIFAGSHGQDRVEQGFSNIDFPTIQKRRYEPYQPGQSASLLWGEHLGFARRCSRAIISVPRHYLAGNPTTRHGFDAKAICLAYGILGRNKGFAPNTLVCNLLEQIPCVYLKRAVFDGRVPPKLYEATTRQNFGNLSESSAICMCAATELALILADADSSVVQDWLEGRMEHQDLDLNHAAARLGASEDRLYQGHYAAMLVSLSVHRIGRRIRPEMMVFHRMCQKEGVEIPLWALQAKMVNRRESERLNAGGDIDAQVEAII